MGPSEEHERMYGEIKRATVELFKYGNEAKFKDAVLTVLAVPAGVSGPEVAICALCGDPMPEGEAVFQYHGYSGPCPKPPAGARDPDHNPYDEAFQRGYIQATADMESEREELVRLRAMLSVSGPEQGAAGGAPTDDLPADYDLGAVIDEWTTPAPTGGTREHGLDLEMLEFLTRKHFPAGSDREDALNAIVRLRAALRSAPPGSQT